MVKSGKRSLEREPESEEEDFIESGSGEDVEVDFEDENGEEEEYLSGSDSEEELEENEEDEDEDEEEDEDDFDHDEDEEQEEDGEEDAIDVEYFPILQQKKPLLTEKDLKRFKETKDNTGVIYMSRIPPGLTPSNLRQHLTPFGRLGRIYLAPIDPAKLKAQAAAQGRKTSKRQKSAFTEGWIEFLNKKEAKRAAEALNGRPFAGRKHSRFHEDLWCLKYLSGFKWSTLTERISYENAVREQKMREEMALARRENKLFLRQVDRAKTNAKIEEKRAAKRAKAESTSTSTTGTTTATNKLSMEELKKRFRQRKPIKN